MARREYTAEIFDMTRFFEAETLPKDPTNGNPLIQHAIRRSENAIWKSRAEPLQFDKADGPLAWILVRSGDLIRIPLLPYRAKQDPVKTMLAGMHTIQLYLAQVPNAIRTHIVLGDPIQEIDGEFRFWLGFAAQLQ